MARRGDAGPAVVAALFDEMLLQGPGDKGDDRPVDYIPGSSATGSERPLVVSCVLRTF
jgi:hypothetical protein